MIDAGTYGEIAAAAIAAEHAISVNGRLWSNARPDFESWGGVNAAVVWTGVSRAVRIDALSGSNTRNVRAVSRRNHGGSAVQIAPAILWIANRLAVRDEVGTLNNFRRREGARSRATKISMAVIDTGIDNSDIDASSGESSAILPGCRGTDERYAGR